VISKLVRAKRINKFRIHDLRHRFAVRWLQAGGDIYALKLHLGHSSVKTTEIYLQFVARDAGSQSAQISAQRLRFGDQTPTGEQA
jgi:integrase